MIRRVETCALMNFVKRSFTALVVMVLSACVAAPQAPVALNNQVLQNQENRVGVMVSKLPELDVHLSGARCLLCLVTVEAMNLSLSRHVKSLNAEEFSVVQSDLVQRLEAKGVNVVPIHETFDATKFQEYSSDAPNTAKLDFSALKKVYDITHLLIVNVEFLGIWRSYVRYFPTSDPVAYVKASSYLVNLDNNTYEWFLPIEFKKSSDGDWDEPPDFPGLTNAYYQVLAEGCDAIVSEF